MSPEKEKNKLKEFIVGFLITALISLSTKIIASVFESGSFNDSLESLFSNFPFIFSWLASALSGGYFGQKWTSEEK